MSLFNRLVVSLLFLAVAALAVALIAAPPVILSAGESLLASLRTVPGSGLVPVAVLVAVLAGLGLLWELWPRRTRVFEGSAEGATVAYPAQTVARVVEQELGGVEGIDQTRAAAVGSPRKLELDVGLAIAPGHDPQHVAARAANQVREKVERGLGLSLSRLRLSIRVSEADRATGVPPVQRARTDQPGAAQAA